MSEHTRDTTPGTGTAMTSPTTAAPHATDERVHALALEDRVRIVVASTTGVVARAAQVHPGTLLSVVALGRLLTGSALIAATTKGFERLSVQVDGDGPVGTLLGRAYPDGRVCGSVRHPGRLPAEKEGGWDVADAVGRSGRLTVIRDLGFGEPWVGNVALQTGEINDDLAHYLETSEQVTSALGASVSVDPEGRVLGAGGYLVQLLGGLGPDEVEELVERVSALRGLGSRVSVGEGADAILASLGLRGTRVLDRVGLTYGSHTDRNYYRARLAAFDSATLDELFGSSPSIELTCEFTGEHHRFRRADLVGFSPS